MFIDFAPFKTQRGSMGEFGESLKVIFLYVWSSGAKKKRKRHIYLRGSQTHKERGVDFPHKHKAILSRKGRGLDCSSSSSLFSIGLGGIRGTFMGGFITLLWVTAIIIWVYISTKGYRSLLVRIFRSSSFDYLPCFEGRKGFIFFLGIEKVSE